MLVTEIPAILLGPLGLLVGALLVIYGGLAEWWVSGAAYRRLLEERNLCDSKNVKLAEIAYTNAAAAQLLAQMQLRESKRQ